MDCVESIASFCDGIDVILAAAPGQTFRYDPKNPPPPGPFETKELEAQAELLELLREASPSAATIDAVQRLARARAALYESSYRNFAIGCPGRNGARSRRLIATAA